MAARTAISPKSRPARFTWVIACVISYVLTTSPAYGQFTTTTSTPDPPGGRSAISVSPAIFDYSVEPGRSFITSAMISNLTMSSMAIRATARDFVPAEEVDPAYRDAYDASGWFQIPTADFLLLPQQQKQVDIHVSIPADAEPGGHYATIYFESFVPEHASSSSSTLINARIGVLALLTVKGPIHQSASIAGPVRVANLQTVAGPTSLKVTMRNDGNVHLMPNGVVNVRDVFGRKAARLQLPPGILLPGAQRDYEVVWEHGLLVGAYKAEAEVFAVPNQPQMRANSGQFWLFPLIIVIPAAILFLLALILAFRRRRRLRRRRNVTSDDAQSSNGAHWRTETDD